MEKLVNALTGRVARNIYFWLLLISTRFEFAYNGARLIVTTVLFILLAALFYGNNLLLVPRFLRTKRYAQYLFSWSALTLVIAALYVTVLKAMLVAHPTWNIGSVSPVVAGEETPSFAPALFVVDWFWYFILLSISGSIFAMSWYVTDYQRQQRIIEEAGKKHLEMELRFLRSQVNPHFLFNSLNNLYTLTLKKSDAAPDVVSRLSAILRYVLYESDTKLVSFARETEVMQAYVDLELLRLHNTSGMDFSFTADRDYMIPPLLWLPVLENMFKHGTRYISDRYYLRYTFAIADNLLQIHSCNNFKPPTEDAPEGVGWANLEQRLKLLFGSGYKVTRTITGDQYIAEITADLACLQKY